MAEYTNLTTLEGLQVGDVVTYTASSAGATSIWNVVTKGFKIKVDINGEYQGGRTIADIDCNNINNLTLYTYVRSAGLAYGNFSSYSALLYYRLLVAGGRGIPGYSWSPYSAGKGGGITGSNGEGSYGITGGTQTSPGKGSSKASAASFGYGGTINGIKSGGAGWYGGGSAPDNTQDNGGGGSGFIIGQTTTTYPDGFLDNDTSLQTSLAAAVTNATTTLGGSTITSDKDPAYIKITIIDIAFHPETQSYLYLNYSGIREQTIVDKDVEFESPVVTLPAGLSLAGWAYDEALTQPITFPISINVDTDIYAITERDTNYAQIIFNLDGVKTYKYILKGEVIPEPDAPEKEGYEFLGWYLNSELFDFSTTASEDIELVAKFIRVYIVDGNTLTSESIYEAVAGLKINYAYSGTAKSITLQPGKYKLEVWGAQGGSYSTSYQGGVGGYSYGTLILNEPTIVYIYAGGQPAPLTGTTDPSSGGFNGGGVGEYTTYGGTSTYAQSGGGGSDIRISSNSLYARVLVAGGGGGASNRFNALTTRYGGGLTSGAYSTTYQATQTSGYSFGTGASSKDVSNYKYVNAASGGGWYGGNASINYSDSTQYDSYNAGGSGYVYTSNTASNYPSGCLLNENYYLIDAETIAGNVSFLSPDGVSETGHTGNGYVRITILSLPIEEPEVLQSILNYYNGTEFKNCYATYYNGTSFIDCDVYYYDGTEFKKIGG